MGKLGIRSDTGLGEMCMLVLLSETDLHNSSLLIPHFLTALPK